MQAVLLRSRKYTFLRVLCFSTLPLVCAVLMCFTWLVNNATMTRQQVISDLGASPGRWQYAGGSDTGRQITSPRNGDPSKYSDQDLNINDTPLHKIQKPSTTSADSAVPAKFRFRMRSDSNETIFDEGFASGFSPKCLKRDYGNLVDWPTASIIITFCDNEILSDILHTLHSVIQRTPPSLIKEILLVADNTTKDDFKETLDNYCKAVFGDKVRIYRTSVTMGLIQARLMAARMAAGDVLVMLDAHMEVQEKWLEALLYEIKKDRKIMATITMDWMIPTENGGWVYRYGPGNFVCYFDWDLVFGYSWPSANWNSIYLNDSTVPLPSPCSVGNWAMEKSFFTEIGELDQGMEKWGGENLDLAIRTWLFGGRSVQIPCSHAAHQERPHQRDYRDAWLVQKYRNYKRLVEVWFDGYKKYFYKAYPELMAFDPGDLSSRLELKKKAKHNFAWYHKHVYPELGLYDVNTLAYGQLMSLGSVKCAYYESMSSPVKMAACRDTKMVMFLSLAGVLRTGAAVVMAQNLREGAKLVYGEAVHFLGDKSLPVWVHWKDGPIKVVGHDLCLENDAHSDSVTLKVCDPCNENQRWRWQIYTPLYGVMLKSLKGDVTDTRWNRIALSELKNLRNSWPSARALRNETDKHSERLLVC